MRPSFSLCSAPFKSNDESSTIMNFWCSYLHKSNWAVTPIIISTRSVTVKNQYFRFVLNRAKFFRWYFATFFPTINWVESTNQLFVFNVCVLLARTMPPYAHDIFESNNQFKRSVTFITRSLVSVSVVTMTAAN